MSKGLMGQTLIVVTALSLAGCSAVQENPRAAKGTVRTTTSASGAS